MSPVAAVQIARDKIAMLGVQLGRLTSHTGKFRLGIGCIDLLAQYAKYKVRRTHLPARAVRAATRIDCLTLCERAC